MSWGKIYCDTNWGENKYRTAGSIINEATPDCFQFPEFVTFKDHVRTEGATYEKMQCGIDILLFLGRSISITPQSPLNPTFSGILDTYTGATAGYSTRRLTNTYTGGLIRVRRSSDDSEQDIGYDANGEDMDIFGLLAFVNAEHTIADEDFSSAIGWTLGSGVSITGGVMRANTSGTIVSYKNFGDPGAQQVRVTFTISNYVSGSVRYMNFATSTTGTPRTANGTYTEILTLQEGGNANHGLQMFNEFVGDIDDFEVVQITADGHVTTFYDQTGNGNHATNSTASEQPLIVDGGSIIYEGATISRPAIEFDGVDDGFITSLAGSSTFDFYSVIRATSGDQFILPDNYSSSSVYFGYLAAASSSTTIHSNYGTPSLYVNGNLETPTTRSDVRTLLSTGNQLLNVHQGADTSAWSYIEMFGRLSFEFDGVAQELIIFDSDQSTNRTGIESNINNYFSIYTP